MAHQLLPAIVFYFTLRTIIRRIARKKRDQALKSSFVKIKGNDVIATTKIFYSLVLVPTLLLVYTLLFGVLVRRVLGYDWTAACKATLAMWFALPIYLAIATEYSYGFAKRARLMKSQLRFRLLKTDSTTSEFIGMLKEKMELEVDILKVIGAHKQELKEFVDKQITAQDLDKKLTREEIDCFIDQLKSENLESRRHEDKGKTKRRLL